MPARERLLSRREPTAFPDRFISGTGSGGNGGYNQRHGQPGGGQRIYRLQFGRHGTFQQSGGPIVGHQPRRSPPAAATSRAAARTRPASLSIGSDGEYVLGGGTLQISGGFVNQGVFDGGNSPGVLSGQLPGRSRHRRLENLGSTVRGHGRNSLLLMPAGFNPATAFGSFSSQGLTHTAGTTMTVPAGKFHRLLLLRRPGRLPRQDPAAPRRRDYL